MATRYLSSTGRRNNCEAVAYLLKIRNHPLTGRRQPHTARQSPQNAEPETRNTLNSNLKLWNTETLEPLYAERETRNPGAISAEI